MSDCAISKIEAGAFVDLVHLRWLDLSDNRLAILSDATFTGLHLHQLFLNGNRRLVLDGGRPFANLTVFGLYLHDSQLTAVDVGTLDSLYGSLRILWLSENRLHRLDPALSRLFASLSQFRLADNRLHCNCELLWLWRIYDGRRRRGGEDTVSEDAPRCVSPAWLSGRHFGELSEGDLRCQAPTLADVEVTLIEDDDVDDDDDDDDHRYHHHHDYNNDDDHDHDDDHDDVYDDDNDDNDDDNDVDNDVDDDDDDYDDQHDHHYHYHHHDYDHDDDDDDDHRYHHHDHDYNNDDDHDHDHDDVYDDDNDDNDDDDYYSDDIDDDNNDDINDINDDDVDNDDNDDGDVNQSSTRRRLLLRCSATGDPTPSVYWIRPSTTAKRVLPPTSMIQNDAMDDVVEALLVLNHDDVQSTPPERRAFTCVASNVVGNVTLTVRSILRTWEVDAENDEAAPRYTYINGGEVVEEMTDADDRRLLIQRNRFPVEITTKGSVGSSGYACSVLSENRTDSELCAEGRDRRLRASSSLERHAVRSSTDDRRQFGVVHVVAAVVLTVVLTTTSVVAVVAICLRHRSTSSAAAAVPLHPRLLTDSAAPQTASATTLIYDTVVHLTRISSSSIT